MEPLELEQGGKQNGYGSTDPPPQIVLPFSGPDNSKILDDSQARLNESPNVILLYRLQALRSLSQSNITLSVMSLTYVGVNVVLLLLNALDRNGDECDDPDDFFIARCGSPTSDYVFHTIEFTGTFIFAVVQAISLVCTPKPLVKIYDHPLVLKCILFFAIVISFVPTVLVWVNGDYFEIVAHEIEYTNELTMSFVDVVLLFSLVKQTDRTDGTAGTPGVSLSLLAVSVAVIQIGIYNGMGRRENGDPIGEKPAHYCEFCFEILSALITFWFCVDNKFVADREIDDIMYGDHQDCAICHFKSLEIRSRSGSISKK